MPDTPKGMLTLRSNLGLVTNIKDICSMILFFFYANPGESYPCFEELTISFRQLAQEYGNDKFMLCNMISQQLTAVLSRYLDNKLHVSCTPKDIEDFKYTISIEITASDNKQLILSDADIFVNSKTGELSIKLRGN